MKKQPDPELLLHDVFEETAPTAFRDALLEQTLRQVRRRNRVRQWNRGLLTMALVFGLPMLAWKVFHPPSHLAKLPAPDFGVVSSQPLPPSMLVESQPGTIKTIASSPATVAFVEAAPSGNLFKEVNDQELLALLADRPAALVRQTSQHAELFFVNPADQDGFPVQ